MQIYKKKFTFALKNNYMLDFKPITPQDAPLFKQYRSEDCFNAENSFANLCSYNFLYFGQYAIVDNQMLIRIHFSKDKQICYYLPKNSNYTKDIVDMLIKDSKQKDYQLNIALNSTKELGSLYDNQFSYSTVRNMYEYLYKTEDLANLQGKKYQPKRNHINQFLSKWSYEVKQINASDKDQCMQMLSIWQNQQMLISPELKRDYIDEQYVIEYLFKYFDLLDLFAIGVYVDKKMIAFSIGSAINSICFDTHIEKADRNYIGSYALINKLMAQNIDKSFIYINREEDKGIMGLRQAKLSYHPCRLIEKYIATYINE